MPNNNPAITNVQISLLIGMLVLHQAGGLFPSHGPPPLIHQAGGFGLLHGPWPNELMMKVKKQIKNAIILVKFINSDSG